MVPACCPPCEEVMSLTAIWLDCGVLPWAGSQTRGQMEWSSMGSRSPRALTLFPQSWKSRAAWGWTCCSCGPGLALSQKIQSIWEAVARGTPGTLPALGMRPASWVLPSPPLPQPVSGWDSGKGARRTTGYRCGPYKGSVDPGAPGS